MPSPAPTAPPSTVREDLQARIRQMQRTTLDERALPSLSALDTLLPGGLRQGPAPCCAQNPPTSCARKSGEISAATTPSAVSCSTPPFKQTEIPTGYPSSQPSASPAGPSPSRELFPPEATDTTETLWRHAISELVRRLLPKRRLRANPSVVKRKYTKWHVKRARHRDWPQPDRSPEQAIVI